MYLLFRVPGILRFRFHWILFQFRSGYPELNYKTLLSCPTLTFYVQYRFLEFDYKFCNAPIRVPWTPQFFKNIYYMLLLHTARALKILHVLCVNKKYCTKNAISYYCLYRVFTVYYNPINIYVPIAQCVTRYTEPIQGYNTI